MAFIDRKTAGRIAGKTLVYLIGAFMALLIVLWWFQVLKFFFYDHWRPTILVLGCCLAWYVVGLALEQFDRRTMALRRRHADPNYYGDDDCA